MSERLEKMVHISDPLDNLMAKWQAAEDAMTPEQKAERERQIIENRKREHDFRVQDFINGARLPKRQLINHTLDNGGEWGQTLVKLRERLGKGFLITLVGVRGSGKTQLGVELVRNNSEDCKSSRYCTAMEFFMDVKAGYKEDGDAEKLIINRYSVPSLLIIDEIGRRSENDWENRLLYELLNRRYNDMSDTLLISNQDLAQLEQALGPSLVSRMRETGGVIECNWQSYRK